MCQICATFNPFLNDCEYEGLPQARDGAETGTGPQIPVGVNVGEVGDAGSTTSTAASMNVGDVFMGTLDTTVDSDWVAVQLTAGQQYTVAIAGTGALTSSNDDPYLRIRDASGTVIELDDDDGPGRYSSHTFTATTTGTYYLDAQSWNSSDAGTYGMSIVEGARAHYNASMAAGTLLRPDQAWTTSPGTGATVSWGVRASGTEPSGGNPFIALSSAQVAAAQDVMSYLDNLSGLNLNQVNAGGTTNSATILIGAYDASDGSGAYAYYPGSIGGNTSFGSNAGDVWMNNNAGSTTSLPLGSYSYFVFLHEVGHAIGLAHPGDYNAAPGVSITYNNNAQFMQDSHQYTVMSYFDETNTGASSLGYPDTFMLHDLLAIHQLYGADTSYNGGNTVYGFNATDANSAYDFSTNSNPFLLIYDGGGTDTVDLSGYAMAQYLNLNQGMFSNIGGYTSNMSIAYGAVIENAIGGSGNDTILGNSANNQITGGGGTDTFEMAINLADATITAITGGYQVVSSLGTDTLFGVEFIQFNDQLLDLSTVTSAPSATTGNDNLSGSATGDTIDLLAGNDSYSGGNGNDSILGNAGDDTLEGGAGADTMDGGADTDTVTYANETSGVVARLDGGVNWGAAIGDVISNVENLIGSAYADTLVGSGLANMLQGGDGNDTLYGEGGNDTLIGGAGGDLLAGGADTDTVTYANEASGVVARLDGGVNWGAAIGDVIVGVENLVGSAHNDVLVGSEQANQLEGGADNDTLYGEGGNDTLIGGAGGDLLAGGADTDTVTYANEASGVVARLDGGVNWGAAIGDVIVGVENLVGSAHNDVLVGSEQANQLEGGADNDTLYGEGGNDTLIGGAGGDLLAGGADTDTVTYANEASGVVARLDGGVNWGAAIGDVIVGVENLVGSAHNDVLVGSEQANQLEGGADNDTLYGEGGNDTLIGGAGGDLLAGGADTDTVTYANEASGVVARLDGGVNWGAAIGDVIVGVENLVGSAHNDVLVGSEQANQLEGGADNDTLYGEGGNDTLIGGAGGDLLAGGADTDTVTYANEASGVVARLDGGVNWGAAIGDVIVGVENLVGSAHNDVLVGSEQANQLEGGADNDTLYGEGGNDTLIGGAGGDLLAGGAGADRFVFADGFGTDEIVGFSIFEVDEVLDLSAVSAITDFADLVANHATQQAANLLINDGAGNTILLHNVLLTDLTQDEFAF